MATFEIDRFAVKPNGIGLLVKWRWVKVLCDENGNITIEDVPGEESINLNCIADYKKTNRSAWPGGLITEFCNFDTHKKYKIYQQDCKPFAYAQDENNVPACGYLTPLPIPSSPPKPFGEATYGLYKTLNICDNKNIPIQLRFFKRSFAGDSQLLDYAGEIPIVISWKNSDDNKFKSIRPSECLITLVSTTNFKLEEFYTEDEREFKVEIDYAAKLKFTGFLMANDASEQFIAPPYDVQLRATDGLGALQKIAYPLPTGSRTNIRQTALEVIIYCLAMTNLNLNLSTICNLYEAKMLNGLNDDPLAQCSINPLRLTDNGKVLDCYAVLEKMCLQFGAFLVQDNGQWTFIRVKELTDNVIRRRTYNSDALFLFADQFDNKRIASCNGSDIKILDDSPLLRVGGPAKRAEVMVEFGKIPFVIYNGDFEFWDGSNFAGWTKHGGIKVSRVEKTIKTTTGEIPINNFALRFDELAQDGKYLEASPVLVEFQDKIKLSYNVGSTTSSLARPAQGVNAFKFRIKLGQYYLTNPKGDNIYEWVKQVASCTNAVYNPKGQVDNYTVNFDMPPIPVNGEMLIELYGFTKDAPGVYEPVLVDNFGLTKSSNADDRTITQRLYIAQQDGFYTRVPEQTKLLFGDYEGLEINNRPTRESNAANSKIQNDFYAILTADGSYATGWYEFGGSSAPNPIGMILAKNILNAYQKSFRFLSSSFLGSNISYLDIFNVDLPNNENFKEKIFTLLSGDLNLLTGELNNANYVEIFKETIKSVEIITSSYVGDPSPPILQNPNPTPPLGDVGIFTNEFTGEFK